MILLYFTKKTSKLNLDIFNQIITEKKNDNPWNHFSMTEVSVPTCMHLDYPPATATGLLCLLRQMKGIILVFLAYAGIWTWNVMVLLHSITIITPLSMPPN